MDTKCHKYKVVGNEYYIEHCKKVLMIWFL